MIDFWQDVPFFTTEISPSLFTLIMQGLILAALLITAYRKWRNESLPAFSKTSGIIIFAVFQFLLLGSLWALLFRRSGKWVIGRNLLSRKQLDERGEREFLPYFSFNRCFSGYPSLASSRWSTPAAQTNTFTSRAPNGPTG